MIPSHFKIFIVLLLISANVSSAPTNDGYAPWVGHDLNGKPCAGREQGYGPYDYTNPNHRAENLKRVEDYHFTKNVETLRKGQASANIAADIDYTLSAFPNHHRALYAMMRYQLKSKPEKFNGIPAVECYFQKAIRFQPNDYRAMQLYASYLVKKRQPKMAINIYKQALSIKDAPVDINYSLGLLYFDLKEYDKAVEQAKIAYAGGIKKSKLANKLKKINRWPVK